MIFNNEQDYTVIAIYMINWIYMINSSEQDCISILVLMQSQSLYWTEMSWSTWIMTAECFREIFPFKGRALKLMALKRILQKLQLSKVTFLISATVERFTT